MTHPPIRFFANDAGVRRFGEGFLACTLAKVEWTHEAHLATCLWLIAERPEIVAECDLPALIRRYNKSVGRVNDDRQGYHETITQVSVAAVRDHLAETGEVTLLGQVNALLKSERGRRDWPLRFYSRERLHSAAARRSWIAPDIASIAAWSRHTERALKRIGSQTDGVGIMGIFDSILGQVSEHVDVANMASKLGIDPAMAEKAIAALGQAHHAPGDTVAAAAAKTGFDTGTLAKIVEQIGGEGSLGQFAQMLKDNPQASGILGVLDRDGDGNPLNDLAGMAKRLFGKS